MLHLSTSLKHYKRIEVQRAMVAAAKDREVAVKFGEGGFGKRPDVLTYPNDILELAKKGATSFHVSEERWQNPLQLSTEMKKQDLEALRQGWDLVLDVDCKIWEYSKRIAHLLIEELKAHNISSITCKFSGNKGFHIGVPFEAFPEQVHGKSVKELFPESVRRIAQYLVRRITPKILQYIKTKDSLERINQELGGNTKIILKTTCKKCKKEQSQKKMFNFICPKCEHDLSTETDEKYKLCPKCNTFMEKVTLTAQRCPFCSSTQFEEQIDLSPLLEVDTVLISTRHLYRMPYSLHEKSGLVSMPINPEVILTFKREDATPEKCDFKYSFLDTSRTKSGEAAQLILQAFDEEPTTSLKEKKEFLFNKEQGGSAADIELLQQKIPAELFPPCIQLGLQGLKDGKKRFLFAVTNFLVSAGYPYSEIEQILHEWNEKNPEPLREVVIKGHLRYHQQQKKKILPPSCDNRAYYKDIGICKPDLHCQKIKNPFQYTKRKAFILRMQEGKEREKLTDEQKAMRQKFREQKKEKTPEIVNDTK